jgi:hypothetical protein
VSAYPYKTQIEIAVASMTLYDYIKRRSQDDVVFTEYDRNPNFILNDFLLDIVARSNCQRSQKILYTIELQIV